MPGPLLIPLIAAGASLAGAGINAASTGHQNRRSREWSSDMYDKQYRDNVSFWNMQNEYNNPTQQMDRLKNAGLNPALMYGGGGGGPGQAGPINTPDIQQAQFRTPDFGNMISGAGTTFLDSMYDYEIKQAQIDNLKADNTVKLSQAALLAAQTGRSEFDLGLETELREISAEARREDLRKKMVDRTFTQNSDVRETLKTSQSLTESAERILNMRLDRTKDQVEITRLKAQIAGITKDNTLKDMDIELRKMGINPNHPMWAQILGRILSKFLQEEPTPPSNASGAALDGMGGSSGGKNVSWRKFLLGF